MWALIFMTVTRFSEPQYVELYQTKQECMAQVPVNTIWRANTLYCVPVANPGKK